MAWWWEVPSETSANRGNGGLPTHINLISPNRISVLRLSVDFGVRSGGGYPSSDTALRIVSYAACRVNWSSNPTTIR